MGVVDVFDKICLAYFIIHIPTTLLLDSQCLLPRAWYPEAVTAAIDDYTKTYQDPFLATLPPWFLSFIVCEMLFQLPLFFIIVYGYWTRGNWVRTPLLVYGSHVATTVVPILTETWFAKGITEENRAILLAIYTPYFLIPALIVVRMWLAPEPFAPKPKTE